MASRPVISKQGGLLAPIVVRYMAVTVKVVLMLVLALFSALEGIGAFIARITT